MGSAGTRVATADSARELVCFAMTCCARRAWLHLEIRRVQVCSDHLEAAAGPVVTPHYEADDGGALADVEVLATFDKRLAAARGSPRLSLV